MNKILDLFFRTAPLYQDLFYGDTKKVNALIDDTSDVNDVKYLGSSNLFNSIDAILDGDDSINIDFLMDDELLPGVNYEYANNYEEFYSNKVTAKNATYGAYLEKDTVTYLDSNLSLFDGDVYLLYTIASTGTTIEFKINSVTKTIDGPDKWEYTFVLERLSDNRSMNLFFRTLSSDPTKYESNRQPGFKDFNVNDTIKFATCICRKHLSLKQVLQVLL